jgi:Uma2 family endonuclease
MATPTSTPPSIPAPAYWTLAEYHRATDAGVFGDRRIELIAGELIEMPPMSEPHIGATRYLNAVFTSALGERVHCQMPIVLPHDGEPEPDIAVAERGAPLKPAVSQVQLAIEVSHSTRRFDRGPKLEAYLADGIRELWIIDLIEQCALLYRGGVLVARHGRGTGALLVGELVPEVSVVLDDVFRAARLPAS